jgi:hypothetical protein
VQHARQHVVAFGAAHRAAARPRDRRVAAAARGSIGVPVDTGAGTLELVPAGVAVVIGGSPQRPRLAPFERRAVPADLSGGDLPNARGGQGGGRGTNRAEAFAYIRAPHDLAALHAWLHRYRDRPATLRTYTREVERFVLWAVIVRGVAVSSVTVEDCEAYKDFLATPSPAFTGPRRPRVSGAWRPFTGALSVDSQAYAVRVLRAAFAWLVSVRYLAGNPWHAMQDPATITRETAIRVERALPARLWAAVRAELAAAAQGDTPAARQWRIARGDPAHGRLGFTARRGCNGPARNARTRPARRGAGSGAGMDARHYRQGPARAFGAGESGDPRGVARALGRPRTRFRRGGRRWRSDRAAVDAGDEPRTRTHAHCG